MQLSNSNIDAIRETLKNIYFRAIALGLDSVEVNNFVYRVSGDEILLLDYTGQETRLIVPDWFDGVAATISSEYSVVAEVREIVLTKRVRIIYENAFINWILLTSIKAPGVEVVEEGAFSSLDVLVEVDMPYLKRLGENAFASCICLSVFSSKKIEYLGKRALSETNLRFISLTALKDAGEESLSYNTELRTVILPSRKFRLVGGMFKNCSKLSNTTIIYTDTLDS